MEDVSNVVCIYKELGHQFILNEFLLNFVSREEFWNIHRIPTEGGEGTQGRGIWAVVVQ